jgi:hypothetical protein
MEQRKLEREMHNANVKYIIEDNLLKKMKKSLYTRPSIFKKVISKLDKKYKKNTDDIIFEHHYDPHGVRVVKDDLSNLFSHKKTKKAKRSKKTKRIKRSKR